MSPVSLVTSKLKILKKKRMVIVDKDGNKSYRMINVKSMYPPSRPKQVCTSVEKDSVRSESSGQLSTTSTSTRCSDIVSKPSSRRCAIKYRKIPLFRPSQLKRHGWVLDYSRHCNGGRLCIRFIRIERLRAQQAPPDRLGALNRQAVAPAEPVQLRQFAVPVSEQQRPQSQSVMSSESPSTPSKTATFRKFAVPSGLVFSGWCVCAAFWYWQHYLSAPPPPCFKNIFVSHC